MGFLFLIHFYLEWWDAMLQKRLAWALLVFLFSTIMCFPTRVDLGFFFLFFIFFPYSPPPLPSLTQQTPQQPPSRKTATGILWPKPTTALWQLSALPPYCTPQVRWRNGIFPHPFLRWSDGMRCCRIDWPGLCLFCCYQTLCVSQMLANKLDCGLLCFINFLILPLSPGEFSNFTRVCYYLFGVSDYSVHD